MQGFQYRHGEQPLGGYTIQRGVGRGGFGEVYYAVSDSGREVALKAVQGYEQVELRGIRQCMNLKNPHLVTIFDVRYNDQDKPFVLMEYVAGPSLRDLLNDSPGGLGAQKAAFFLREIGKGLTYLHDRGIVHRDLKPGNIFYEDGYVKIGDYGLSKAITASQHSGQTVTVGTVHYMAPEIGQGRYDRSIDIYALGVVLYEMVTGQVPFLGASPGEILMKHMATEPDLAGIDEPFAAVIRRAMAKDPTDRYQTVQEMIEAVFGAEHIRQSVSHFSPDSLSAVAERAAQKVGAGARAGGPGGGPGSSGDPTMTFGAEILSDQGSSKAWEEPSNWWDEFGQRMGAWGERMGRWGSRFGQDAAERAKAQIHVRAHAEGAIVGDPRQDPLGRQQRRMLAWTAAAVVAFGTDALAPQPPGQHAWIGIAVFFAILGGAAGIRIARYRLNLQSESGLVLRLAYGGLACALSMILGGVVMFIASDLLHYREWLRFTRYLGGTLLAIYVPLFLLNWQHRTDPARANRVSLGAAVWAGLLGLIAAFIFEGVAEVAVGVLAGISLAAQVVCPFDPNASKRLRSSRWQRWHGPPTDADQPPDSAGTAATPPPPGPPPAPSGPAHAQERRAQAAERAREWAARGGMGRSGGLLDRPVPTWVRPLALLGFMLLLSLGLAMILWGAIEGGDDEIVIGLGGGIGSLLLAGFCLVKTFQATYRSWWSSLVKPLVMLACIECIFCAAMCLGAWNLRDEEVLIGLLFLILPIPLFIVVAALPNAAMHPLLGGVLPPRVGPLPIQGISQRRRLWALLLACGLFMGVGGLHRFYVGKIWTGLLWLVTGGLLGIGQIYDVIMIALGQFRDCNGLPLVIWHSEDELRRSPPIAPAAHLGGYAPQAGAAAQDQPHAQAAPPVPPGPDRPAEPYPIHSAPTSRIRRPIEVGSIMLSMIGAALLTVAVVVALPVAADLPRMTASGLFGEGLARHLERELGGYRGWPQLASNIGMAVTVILGFLGTGILIVARRRGGFMHMARAALGAFGLLFAVCPTLQEALEGIKWDLVAPRMNNEDVGEAIDLMLGGVDQRTALIAGILFLVSIMVLVWPRRRQPVEAPSQAGEVG